MTYDVNKIIEESVKDIIDSDNEDILQEGVEAEDNLEAQGSAAEEFGASFMDKKVFEESRNYLKEFVKEDVEGKK
jgi:hypothetical protein